MTYLSKMTSIMVCSLSAGTAAAQTVAVAPPLPRVAITFSPIHLVLPVGELTGEVRVVDKLGVAAVAGWGRVKDAGITFTVFELGTQIRYYLVGDFRHGMQLGAEGLYVNAGGEKETVSGVADGFAVGPFAGYKYTASVGFTFDAQLGVERMIIHASAKDSAGGGSATDSKSNWIPLINLNVGWSF